MIKVLSLDTATKVTGYALYEGITLRSYGTVNCSEMPSVLRRLCMLDELMKAIAEYKPAVVCIERASVLRNAKTQRELDRLIGTVEYVCHRKHIAYIEYPPNTWRKLVARNEEKIPKKRNELKEWGVNLVSELYGINVTDDNESDAILIGRAYLNECAREDTAIEDAMNKAPRPDQHRSLFSDKRT